MFFLHAIITSPQDFSLIDYKQVTKVLGLFALFLFLAIGLVLFLTMMSRKNKLYELFLISTIESFEREFGNQPMTVDLLFNRFKKKWPNSIVTREELVEKYLHGLMHQKRIYMNITPEGKDVVSTKLMQLPQEKIP